MFEKYLNELKLNFVFPIDADIRKGAHIFGKLCGSCHHLNENSKNEPNKSPALGNVYGRIVGADAYYDYSPIFDELSFRWNRKILLVLTNI